MNWLFYSIASPAVLAFGNFVDKFVVETRTSNYYVITLYIAIINFVAGLIVWLLSGAVVLEPDMGLILILSGMLGIFSALFYFNALSSEEMSNIAVLGQMTPIWVLILSSIFLDEVINAQQLLGFGLILTAAIAVSLQQSGKDTHTPKKKKEADPINATAARWGVSRAFWLMLVGGVIWAVISVMRKGVVDAMVVDMASLATSVAYSHTGIGLGGLVLYAFAPVRRAFHESLSTQGMSVVGLFSLSEVIFLTSQFLYFAALSLGPVSLVTVVGSSHVFFVILLGWLLTLIAPTIFKESISRGELLRKAMWAGVLLVGIALVS